MCIYGFTFFKQRIEIVCPKQQRKQISHSPQKLREVFMNISILIASIVALAATLWIHPYMVKIAHIKNIVDNPDARKLQKRPIPVLGGAAVFFGMMAGIGITNIYADCSSLFIIVTAMMTLLYIGIIDDILDLSARLRFVIEILVVVMLMLCSGRSIDSLHGLGGYYLMPMWVAFPFTIFATVGIINAINLIDGVDGLSSGFSIMASLAFGIYFYIIGYHSMVVLAAAAIGSMIPFFLHNVLGKRSKMFIGDGGTLAMGVVLATFVVFTLTGTDMDRTVLDPSFGLVPFSLSVMAIPVFDTMRVMSARILQGTSPFHPDKTHLHHLFIELGFSHVGTSLSILTLNFIIIAAQIGTWLLGGDIAVQLYVVVGLSLLFTVGLYYGMKRASERNPIKRALKYVGRLSQSKFRYGFVTLQRIIDKI